MAEVIDKLPNQTNKGFHLYPWSEWLDGRAWKLSAGTDFKSSPSQFRSQCYQAATRFGVKVHVLCQGDDMYIQAYEPGANGEPRPGA